MKRVFQAVALVIVGMLLALLVLPHFGFDFGFLGSFRPQSNSRTVNEPFDAIQIRGGVCDVDVSTSYDGRCQVYVRDLDGTSAPVRVEDGTLTVAGGGERSWLEKLKVLDEGERYISISLPEDMVCALTVETGSGDIYVSDELTFTNASVTADSGDISFHAGVEGEAALGTGSGDIYMSTLSLGSLTARTDSGELDLDGVTASGAVELSSGSGDIWLWDCDGESFQIGTDSGDVSASFLRRMDFVTDSDSGNVDAPLPDRSAGRCQVTTGSGDIWLYVED